MKNFLWKSSYFLACYLFWQSAWAQTSSNPLEKNYLVKTTGEKYFGKVQIQRDTQGNFVIVFNDTTNFDLGKINGFENTEGRFAIAQKHYLQKQRGFTENILLKRVIVGKVDIYGKYDLILRRPGIIHYDYFSIKKESLQEVDFEHLRSSLQDNPQSMKLLDQHQNYKRLSLLLFGAGLTTTFYGLAKGLPRKLERPPSAVDEGPGFKWKPATYAGIGITLTAFIPYFLKERKLAQALEAYNRP